MNDLKKINFKKKVAFLFGSESSGLSNEEISYANYTLQIPTNPEFKSLNLSHSVIVIAQFVSSLIKIKTLKYSKSKKIKSASKQDINNMPGVVTNGIFALRPANKLLISKDSGIEIMEN